MKFETTGNLGKIDLLERHLMHKYFNDDGSISKEELEEVAFQLKQFRYLLANVNMYKNSLENDGYGALVKITEELSTLYSNYKKEYDLEVKNVF